MELGRVGVWWSGRWESDRPDVDVAAELEALGYGAIWSSGGIRPGLSSRFERLLGATTRLVVASGIVSVWTTAAAELARAVDDLERRFGGRLLFGIGASHSALVQSYVRPYSKVVGFLDALDAAEPTVPIERRALAALGPRMLELAARRTAGAHPYLVPVDHTVRARTVLGPGPLLAPELTVVLDDDAGRARALARSFVSGYLSLPNYARNLGRLGFEDDMADGGSDRLIDAVVAWGDEHAVSARVREHHDAGADHVCLQVLTGGQAFPLDEYRRLAAAVC